MKAWQMVCVATGAALLASSPANAQAANDVKCLMASNLFSKAAKDPKARQIAEVAKYFYLGRVTGKLSEPQIRTQMLAQTKTLNPKNAAATMQACTRQMQSAATEVERVGKQLQSPKK